MPGDASNSGGGSGRTSGASANAQPSSNSTISAKKRLKLYRSRSNTDSEILPQRTSLLASLGDSIILNTTDEVSFATHRRRLYELFGLIEKEFESLYAENLTLSARVEALTERLTDGGTIPPEKAAEIINAISCDVITPKSVSGKKASQVGQKLKTAFRVQPGRNLVSSFKAGVTGVGGDASRARFVKSYEGHRDGVWHVDTSQTQKPVLGSAGADQTARIWCIETGACLLQYTGHYGSVNGICFNPMSTNINDLLVVTASGDQSAHIWKANLTFPTTLSTCSSAVAPKQPAPVSAHHSSEDELEPLSEREETVVENENEHSIHVRTPLIKLTGHTSVVIHADWLMGGSQIITASWDRTSMIYDAERGEILHTLTGHDQELTHCSAHRNQKLVVTSSRDTTFRLWDFRDPIHSVAVFQGHTESVTSTVFSSADKIVSGSDDRSLKVWDLRNMRTALATIRTDSPVNRLALSQVHNIIAIPHDNRHVRLYDLNGQRVGRLPRTNRRGHRRMVACAVWSDENHFANLFTCGFDKQVLGWKIVLNASKEKD